MSHATDALAQVRDATIALELDRFETAASQLLGAIGYASPKTLAIDTSPAKFIAELNIDAAKLDGTLLRIKEVHFLFQLTGDELPALSRNTTPQTGAAFQRGAIDSFVFLAVDLDDGTWSRRELVTIVRELNRGFAMPAIILFRHGSQATLAVIDRRANRRDPSRDVVGGRISLVKDIDLAKPHRAHVEILADLSLTAITRRKAPSDFRDLYDRWIETLSAAELNKRFYAELADWFAWASTKPELVTYPKGQPENDGGKEVAFAVPFSTIIPCFRPTRSTARNARTCSIWRLKSCSMISLQRLAAAPLPNDGGTLRKRSLGGISEMNRTCRRSRAPAPFSTPRWMPPSKL